MTRFYTQIASRLGPLLLTSDDTALTGCYFVGQKYFPASLQDWREHSDLSILRLAGEQLQAYFAAELQQFELPLRFASGTAFQHRIWHTIATLPYGQTLSYQQLAKLAGATGSARAAGSATGRNPLSIVVPCHRVIASNGALTGYAGGLERKKQLLAMESETIGDRV